MTDREPYHALLQPVVGYLNNGDREAAFDELVDVVDHILKKLMPLTHEILCPSSSDPGDADCQCGERVAPLERELEQEREKSRAVHKLAMQEREAWLQRMDHLPDNPTQWAYGQVCKALLLQKTKTAAAERELCDLQREMLVMRGTLIRPDAPAKCSICGGPVKSWVGNEKQIRLWFCANPKHSEACQDAINCLLKEKSSQ